MQNRTAVKICSAGTSTAPRECAISQQRSESLALFSLETTMEQFSSLCVARGGGRINSSRDSCICTTHDWPLLRAHSVLYVCVWLIIYLWICECGRVQSARLRLRPSLPKSLLWRDNCTHAADEHLYDLCVVKVAKCIHCSLMENNTWRYNSQFEIKSYKVHVIKRK
jgi:hypothetical protein